MNGRAKVESSAIRRAIGRVQDGVGDFRLSFHVRPRIRVEQVSKHALGGALAVIMFTSLA